jgi:small-conductance mechanosensitive channel
MIWLVETVAFFLVIEESLPITKEDGEKAGFEGPSTHPYLNEVWDALASFTIPGRNARSAQVKNRTELLPRLLEALQFENYAVALLAFMAVWATRSLFVRSLSQERKQTLVHQERSCLKFAFASLASIGAFRGADFFVPETARIVPLLQVFGLVTLFVSFVWISKLIRLGTFVVSFALSPQRPVPLLLINVITVLLATAFALLLANEVLGFSVLPLLATSAVLSLVLGLALQDTLGNLLTGIALQIDKPFRIGDWIELQGSGLKTIGQVTEITWRATILKAFTDEMLVVPNRTVAQSQISNYSSKREPVLRSHAFRFPYGTNLELVRMALLEVVRKTPGIHTNPAPAFILVENGESWITCKLLYSIVDFGEQFLVGDKVLVAAHGRLQQLGIRMARPTYEIVQRELDLGQGP